LYRLKQYERTSEFCKEEAKNRPTSGVIDKNFTAALAAGVTVGTFTTPDGVYRYYGYAEGISLGYTELYSPQGASPGETQVGFNFSIGGSIKGTGVGLGYSAGAGVNMKGVDVNGINTLYYEIPRSPAPYLGAGDPNWIGPVNANISIYYTESTPICTFPKK
jgi:hypothetical protein